MCVENKIASCVFKLFIAAVGTLALTYAAGLWNGTFNPRFLCMFTNISNLAVTAYFWCAAIMILRGSAGACSPWRHKLKYALMLAITVTWLVAHFLLDWGMVFQGDAFHPEMLVLHYIVPICTIIDWLVFDQKGSMSYKDVLAWPLFPLGYVVYICVLVAGFGVVALDDGTRWPYPFLNFDALGPLVLANIVGLLAAFMLIGCLYVFVDRMLAKRR